MDWLLRTKSFLDACQLHIDETSSQGSEVEAFLSQYLLVSLCAEMQEEIYRVIEGRAQACGDDELCGFAIAASKKILRSVRSSEIAGFVGHFGQTRKQKFNDALDERVTLQYNTAVESRHSIAHRGGAQVTLAEIREIVASAGRVLDSARLALADERQLG